MKVNDESPEETHIDLLRASSIENYWNRLWRERKVQYHKNIFDVSANKSIR